MTDELRLYPGENIRRSVLSGTLCLLCSQPLGVAIAYVAVWTPEDGPSFSSGICPDCGQQTRQEVERAVLHKTLLYMYEAGHA